MKQILGSETDMPRGRLIIPGPWGCFAWLRLWMQFIAWVCFCLGARLRALGTALDVAVATYDRQLAVEQTFTLDSTVLRSEEA